MDPALARLIEAGDPGDEVAVLIRWEAGQGAPPPGVRIVSTFGDVSTVRVARGVLEEVRGHDMVRSIKATALFRADVYETIESLSGTSVAEQRARRRPAGFDPTGRGVVVGVTDWGLDVTHPTFRNRDGSTRVLALWDQQPGPDPAHPNKYGYGRIHLKPDIDEALRQPDPAGTLGYFAYLSDTGGGTHGTATTSIAAGSGWPGGVEGVAPDADIVFVHLSTWGPAGPHGLGDSAALAEAFDFIRTIAAGRPCVINCSLGGTGGPHDGSNLLERLMDAFVLERPGQMIAQSCGNYFEYDTHTEGELLAGQQTLVPFHIQPGAFEDHRIDVWYSGVDRLTVGLIAPGGEPRALTRPGQHTSLDHEGKHIADIRHRVDDPNDGRNQVLITIAAAAPAGTWQLTVQAADVVDGRFHAWIEREPVGHRQMRFASDYAVPTTTTGTICNGLRTLSVGAYDARTSDRPLCFFTSSGPTVDGRHKPDLLAPGSGVLVARSRPAHSNPGDTVPLSTVMSGTSIAAPHVTGAVACLLETRLLPAGAIRSAILEKCEPYRGNEPTRAGSGYLRLGSTTEQPSDAPASDNVPIDTTAQLVLQPAAFALQPAAAPAGAGSSGQSNRSATPLPENIPSPSSLLDIEVSGQMSTQSAPADPSVASYAAVITPDALDTSHTDTRVLPQDPDALLAKWDTTAYQLFQAYVLDSDTAVLKRLSGAVSFVAGPHDRIDALHAGDLLIRGHIGEGHAVLSVLIDGELVDNTTALQRAWQLEGSLPGRYAWVIEGGNAPHIPDECWARRITDRPGFVLGGQALLRQNRDNGNAPAAAPVTPAQLEVFADSTESITAEPALRSPRFVGDPNLDAVLAGKLRLAAPGTSPWPAPVLSNGPAIAKVQRSLIDLGYALPHGADGRFGPETGSAVTQFKTGRHIQPDDPVVGRGTITALDNEILGHDRPSPTPVDPQLRYTDRKSHYTNVALRKANDSSHPAWDPNTGWDVNRPRVVDAYAYYRDLALAKPDTFLWAGLGHMAGGAIVGGMDANHGVVPESIMIAAGRDIFYDLAWQHEAFLDAPADVVALADLHDRFATYPRYGPTGQMYLVQSTPATSYGAAWRKICSGDPKQIADGNLDLLRNEQASIVQPHYDRLRQYVGSGLIKAFTNEIHPYHRAFLIDCPTGEILDFPARWGWITLPNGMWENWVAAGAAERIRLVEIPFDWITRGQFGVPGRPDLLPPGGP